MLTPGNLRDAWDDAFDNIIAYGDYADEIRDAVKYIADDEIESAGRAIEAIHAEDDDDERDQVEEIVTDMSGNFRLVIFDLLRSRFSASFEVHPRPYQP